VKKCPHVNEAVPRDRKKKGAKETQAKLGKSQAHDQKGTMPVDADCGGNISDVRRKVKKPLIGLGAAAAMGKEMIRKV